MQQYYPVPGKHRRGSMRFEGFRLLSCRGAIQCRADQLSGQRDASEYQGNRYTATALYD